MRTIHHHIIAKTLISLALFVGGTPAVAQQHQHHTKGCNTHACDMRVGRTWAKKHQPKTEATSFDLCVANRESGEPGMSTWNTINWHLDQDGTHTGAFQWDHATWKESGGLPYAYEAYQATPQQQLKAFKRFYPGHESRWAETAPYC